jgi:hypothetical protein
VILASGLPRFLDTIPWPASRHLSPSVPDAAAAMARPAWLLPQAVHDAGDQELTWTQIGELLNTTADTAARRYRTKP